MGSRPTCEDKGQLALPRVFLHRPVPGAALVHLESCQGSSPQLSAGRRPWVPSWLWVEHRLVLSGCASAAGGGGQAVKTAAVQAEHWREWCCCGEPPTTTELPGVYAGWAGSVGAIIPTSAYLGPLADDLPTWRVFKDSKKNEGLSGAAVFSDSVIMPLKILIVLAVCIWSGAEPPLIHPATPAWFWAAWSPGVLLGGVPSILLK